MTLTRYIGSLAEIMRIVASGSQASLPLAEKAGGFLKPPVLLVTGATRAYARPITMRPTMLLACSTVGDCVTITYEVADPYTIAEAHLWVGETLLSMKWVRRGKNGGKWVPTSAPGQFPFSPEIAEDGLSATWTIRGTDVENGF